MSSIVALAIDPTSGAVVIEVIRAIASPPAASHVDAQIYLNMTALCWEEFSADERTQVTS